MSNRPPHAYAQGLTLIEMIMFIMIVGVALAAVVGVLNFTAKNSAEPLRRKQALMIAEGLLEEVRLAGFTFCDANSPEPDPNVVTAPANCGIPEAWGNEGGAPRPFDNVNDYVTAPGQAQASFNVSGLLSDASGAPLNVQGYSARVTITPQVLGGIGDNGNNAHTDVLRIRIEVDYGGERLVLDGYRARYAPTVHQ